MRSAQSRNEETKPSTGTIVKTKLGLWQPVVTLADGSRKRLTPFPAGTSEAEARDRTRELSATARPPSLTKVAKVIAEAILDSEFGIDLKSLDMPAEIALRALPLVHRLTKISVYILRGDQ